MDLLGLHGNDRRYGHSAILHPGGQSMLVFGGFFGTTQSSLLALEFGESLNCQVTTYLADYHSLALSLLGNCSQHATQEECVENLLCGWSPVGGRCEAAGLYSGQQLDFGCEIGQSLSAKLGGMHYIYHYTCPLY